MTSSRLGLVCIMFLAASLLVLSTCGKDSPTKSAPTAPPAPPAPPPPPPPPVATRIEVTPSSATLNAIGQTVQLTARIIDQYGAAINGASTTWTSGATGIATVSNQGLVTAVKNGSTVVTVRSGSLSATVSISVSQAPGRIVIEPQMASLMTLGETVQLTAAVQDRNHQPVSGAEVTWTSSDTDVASVSEQGLVTAVGNGIARITARSGSASAAIEVTVMAPNPDREVLSMLYEATNGPDWTVDSNWLTDAPLSEWHGVTTNANERVVILNLWTNNLGGSIPAEVGLLTYIEELNLGSNKISGEIPASIGELANLDKLNLGNNSLSGEIPASMGRLSNLTELTITWNELTGSLPAELGNLTRLNRLALYRNQLSGEIPAELGRLSNLSRLDIGDNQFSGEIPATLGQMANLLVLSLENNNLSGQIPTELGRLARLEIMALSQNQLTGVPPSELGNLGNLRTLLLEDNSSMSGPLPYSFTNLNLGNLNLGGTELCIPAGPVFQAWIEGIENVTAATCPDPDRTALTALYNETDGPNWAASTGWPGSGPLNGWHGITTDVDGRVTEVNLEDNNLVGSLPYVMGDLARLKKLYLGGNSALTGPLPHSFTDLDLEALHVDGTQLCASDDPVFQAWLQRVSDHNVATCGIASLDREALIMLYNATGGPNWNNDTNWLSTLPLDEWVGVTATAAGRVTALNLRNNNLSGSLPREIGQLTGLTTLNLSFNNLNGQIPPDMGRLSDLTELDLFSNALSGTIPSQLGRLSRLEQLMLAANKLTGAIPPELSLLSNLSSLNVYNNKLTGTVPPELGQLVGLEELILGQNDLTGGIPPELGNLAALNNLDLSDNRLSGYIPVELCDLQGLNWLTLSRNQLRGEIPTELGRLTALSGISLAHNRLTGEIPATLWNLTRLKWLQLYFNRLSGELPPELGQLTSLETLDLSNNAIGGAIPSATGKLVHLAYLYLNNNRFTGNIPPELANLSRLRALNVSNNTDLTGPLPRELTSLDLTELVTDGTGLCAVENADFQLWLSGIGVSRVPDCVRSTGSVAYLIQATQSFSNPVPLIAGEAAFLRVFVISDSASDTDMPPVRATFYHDGVEVHSAEIASNDTSIPMEVNEGSLSASLNEEVPGWVVMPGLEMVVEIDPEDTADDTMAFADRIPASGRTAVDVRTVAPLDLTLVPFLWSENPDRSILAELAGLSENHDLFWQVHELLPVNEFSLTVRDPVLTSVDPVFENKDQILRDTKLVREMDNADGHYMGIITDGGGIAELGGTSTVAGLSGFVIAHELGHNMGLMHAPCGSPDLIDRAFPHVEGTIGAWGFDRRNNQVVDTGTYDLMGYCDPKWISDYSFSRALRNRLASSAARVAVRGSAGRSLVIWGGVNDAGDLVLEPAFVVDTESSLPLESGPYRIYGEDMDGNTLFNLSFNMRELVDGNGGVFAFLVPARADWSGRLSRIALSGPEGFVAMTRNDSQPAALLINSASGNVRGILRDWPSDSSDLQTARRALPEPELDIITSAGIPNPADWE